MRCERCGADIPQGASTCEQCGAPLPSTPEAAKTVRSEDIQAAPPEETIRSDYIQAGQTASSPPKRRTCLWFAFGCTAFVLVMLCLCVVIVSLGLVSFPWDIQPPVNELLAMAEDISASSEQTQVNGLQPVDDEIFLISTSAPEVTAEMSPDFEYDGVSISYRDWLDVTFMSEAVPIEAESMFGSIPEHIELHLKDYPLSDTFHQPVIYIYRVSDLEAMELPVDAQIDDLNLLLQSKPASPESVPFVIFWNAGPLIQSNVKYLFFENGGAVRFLSQYGQAIWPINNTDLFYGFQGITDDGEYIITAVLPVSHPSLPVDGETLIMDDFDGFVDGFPEYIAQIEIDLNSNPPGSFSPNLLHLDAMMETLRLEKGG